MDREPNPGDERSLETDGGDGSSNSGESTVEVDARSAVASDDQSVHGHGSATKQPLGPDESYCWSCGVPVKSAAEVCPTCGVRQHSPPNRQGKSPGLAALASAVWVGAGQIYNGEIGKGIGLMVLMFVSTIAMFVIVGIVTTPLIWAYAVYDAYRTAENNNQRPATPTHEF